MCIVFDPKVNLRRNKDGSFFTKKETTLIQIIIIVLQIQLSYVPVSVISNNFFCLIQSSLSEVKVW